MEPSFEVILERRKGYEFEGVFPETEIKPLTVDERPPLGGDLGPNPSRTLALAVGHCLSSSLLFCLSKAQVPVEGAKTRVRGTLERNERGRWRIAGLTVVLEISTPKESLGRCREVFEDYCIVTESVRRGIPVEVEVRSPGEE